VRSEVGITWALRATPRYLPLFSAPLVPRNSLILQWKTDSIPTAPTKTQ
jgi:hypothetical protein